MADSKIHELDFIKGLATLSVILLHTVGSQNMLYEIYAFFHIWQAVPLFIFISYYLLFTKLDKQSNISISSYFSATNFKKIIKKVVIPFAIIELLVIIVSEFFSLPMSALGIIRNLGVGPGAYYPYVYIQLWLSAPFIFILLERSKWGGMVLFFTCIALNVIVYRYIPNDRIYSCLLVRYLFIAFLAYQWCQGKTKVCLLLSIVSIIYYFLIIKYDISFSPWIDSRWELQQLPAFFYTLLLFAFLYKSHSYIYRIFGKTTKFVECLGRCSYEIFLLQMFFLVFFSYDNTFFVHLGLIGRILFVCMILFLSIVSAFIYKTAYEKFSNHPCTWWK